jgi:hypothetical protein
MALDLRPLTLPELLDRSFSTYKQHLWLFVGIMAMPAAIAMLYGIAMQLLQFSAGVGATPGKAPSPEQILRFIGPAIVGVFVFLAVYMSAYAFALGATTIAVAHIYNQQAVTVGRAYREVRRHGWRLILLLVFGSLRLLGIVLGIMIVFGIVGALSALISPILSGLVVVVAFVGSAAATIYVMTRYGVAVPAVVLEGRTAGQALGRSVELTEDHRGRVFLLLLCAIVITYATAVLFQAPFMVGAFVAGPGTTTALVFTLTGAVLGALGGMFSGPLMIIGLSMIYYDLRIRKEGLDLQMMLEALDAPRA